MHQHKIAGTQTANYWRTVNFLCCFSFMIVACNNTDPKLKAPVSPAPEISQAPEYHSEIDTNLLQVIKTDSLIEKPKKAVATTEIKKEPQIRAIKGVSDASLNGEQILLKEELAKSIFQNNPDTIKNYLKLLYLGQERNFPRSIADDFKRGISKEIFSYPTLNYRVELFEDAYAKKPYKILGYAVRKEGEKIIVE